MMRFNTRWRDSVFVATLRGMATGEPHLGDAVWPTLNSAIISITEDDKADALLAAVRKIDEENPKLGLRAFWWSVGGTI